MDINVRIHAPELVESINALAAALAGKIELLLMGPGSRSGEVHPDIQEQRESKPQPKPEPESKQGDPSPATQELEPAESEKEYTLEEVRAKFVSKNSAKNRDILKQLLADFGVKKVTELQEKDFAAVMARLEEI
jgi:uncharacterized protein